MKKGTKIAIGIGSLALISVGGFFLYKKFLKKDSNFDVDSITSSDINTSTSTSTSKTNSNSVDKNKKLSRGSRGESVKSSQKLLNSIINIARKSPKNSDSSKEARRKKIADFSYLVEDGIWGRKTDNVHSVIMGRKSSSINDLIKKQSDFRNAYNPK